MNQKKSILFLHGGPGGNTLLERTLLGPALAQRGYQAEFWNEPSAFRPDCPPAYSSHRPFERWLESAENALLNLSSKQGPVHLIAHSFASLPARLILERNLSSVAAITLITPAFDLFEAYKGILRIAEADFARQGNAWARDIKWALSETRSFFDPVMESALRKAAQDPELFLSYWHNRDAMNEWFAGMSVPGYAFDLESFFAVSADLASQYSGIGRTQGRFDIPAGAIFGAHDVLIAKEKEERICETLFSDLTKTVFKKSAHYPQHEERELFLKTLLDPRV